MAVSSQKTPAPKKGSRPRTAALGGHPSAAASEVRDRESGVGPGAAFALRSWCLAAAISGRACGCRTSSSPTMSRIVAGLERAGLVKRRKTEDGRRVRLEACARGTKILQEGRLRRVESLAKALYALSEERAEAVGPACGADATSDSKSNRGLAHGPGYSRLQDRGMRIGRTGWERGAGTSVLRSAAGAGGGRYWQE